MNKKELNMNPAALRALLEGDLENALFAATPGGIEAQEKVGQTIFVANETLPHKFNGCKKEDFEKMGVVFGKKVDDLFSEVTLPVGWKKIPTEHSMWSRLVDHKGRVRASIFYKAAFYDLDAFLNLAARFTVACKPEDQYETKMSHEGRQAENWYGVVLDGGKRSFKTKPVKAPDYAQKGILEKEAIAWLEKDYPEWRDATKYWAQEIEKPKVGQRKVQIKEN